MTIIKLPREGDAATLTIKSAGPEKGKFGWQVKFEATNGDLLYIGQDSADRQLVRCGFGEPGHVDYPAIAGATLHFSRDPNPNAPDKPYWSIQLAAAHEAKPKPEPKRLTKPPLETNEPKDVSGAEYVARTTVPGEAPAPYTATAPAPRSLDAVTRLYTWAWNTAAHVQVGAGKATPESIQAGAATLMIAADKAGIRDVPPVEAPRPAVRVPSPFAGAKGSDDREPLPDPAGEDLDSADLPF